MKNKLFMVPTIVIAIIAIFGISQVANASALTIGSTGNEVVELQGMLIEAGFDIPALTSGSASFGYYGVQTKKAHDAYLAGIKSPILGAVVGPDLFSPYWSVDGVRHEYRRQASFRNATTTPCALKSPNATSTLVFASLQTDTGTSTATTWTIAQATTGFATTTALGTFTVASGAKVSTTTPVFVDNGRNLIAPNQFIVYGLAGLTAANQAVNISVTGTCQAEFIVL